jgi:hypothetical protein
MIIILPSVLGLVIIILISGFVYILKNPDIIDKWSVLFNKLFSFGSEKAERNIISKNIDYKITHITKQINREAEGILPYGIRIKWRKPTEVQSYVQRNEVVIVLHKNDNLDKNIIEACMAYIPKGLLPKSRNCIAPAALKSIDLFMVKSILNNGNYDSAYNYFMTNVYNPTIFNNANLENYMHLFDQINTIGFFTRILLEEFRRLGNKLYGTGNEQSYFQETVDFIIFLRQLANRRPGDFSKLSFMGDNIKIALIYVARRSTLFNVGIEAYISRIEKDIDLGVQRIFFLSYSQFYEEVVNDSAGFVVAVKRRKEFLILNELEKHIRQRNDLIIIKKQKYKTKDVSGNWRSAKYILCEVTR